jgi:hypothetical protein
VTVQHLHRLQVCQAVLPHLRFGQLISNALQEKARRSTPKGSPNNLLFYLQDEELVRTVEAYTFNRDQL